MGRRHQPRSNQPPPRFTQSQIQQMLKAFLDNKEALLDQTFYQKVTEEINIASGHAGKKAIHWRQVRRWHEHRAAKDTPPSIMSNGQAFLPDASLSNNTPDSSSDIHKDDAQYIKAGEKASDVAELEFEARSSRDGAWYDVATFLEERVASSGELEVCVRYQGFGSEEDEWVNLKKAVRVRSIPLESSECCKVAVGDVVLCFQEKGDDAAYFDAHVIEIQRKLHDIRGCRCIFLIRYGHNQTEERVHLRRLCRRP